MNLLTTTICAGRKRQEVFSGLVRFSGADDPEAEGADNEAP